MYNHWLVLKNSKYKDRSDHRETTGEPTVHEHHLHEHHLREHQLHKHHLGPQQLNDETFITL